MQQNIKGPLAIIKGRSQASIQKVTEIFDINKT